MTDKMVHAIDILLEKAPVVEPVEPTGARRAALVTAFEIVEAAINGPTGAWLDTLGDGWREHRLAACRFLFDALYVLDDIDGDE